MHMGPLKGGEGSIRNYSVSPFLLATSFFLLCAASPWTSQTQGSENSCVWCHTDTNRMKALITKFPELPEEEGEA